MIKKDTFIKHKDFADVCILVKGSEPCQNGFRVWGEWINLGFDKSFPMSLSEAIKIPSDEVSNWQVCLNPDEPCLRGATWGEL